MTLRERKEPAPQQQYQVLEPVDQTHAGRRRKMRRQLIIDQVKIIRKPLWIWNWIFSIIANVVLAGIIGLPLPKILRILSDRNQISLSEPPLFFFKDVKILTVLVRNSIYYQVCLLPNSKVTLIFKQIGIDAETMRSQLRDHTDICGQLVMAPPVEKILRGKEETNPEKLFNLPVTKIHLGLHVSELTIKTIFGYITYII